MSARAVCSAKLRALSHLSPSPVNVNIISPLTPAPPYTGTTSRTRSTSPDQQRHLQTATSPSTSSPTQGIRNSGRIYILGVGNIGKFFGHALANEPSPPPITLLLHRASVLEAWEQSDKVIEIIRDGASCRTGMFDVELIKPSWERAGSTSSSNGMIDNLIVATKTTSTTVAIQSIAHRLTPATTILFAQNGMGTSEEVTRNVFPDSKTRPQYLACVTSHGIYSKGLFSSVHAGAGTVAVGDMTQDQHLEPPRSAYLLQKIVQAPSLASRKVSRIELTQLQLEKLVINAMINPLTVIFDRRNGDLFGMSEICRLMNLLLAEASHVIRLFPEIRSIPSAQDRFATSRLMNIVVDVAEKTAQNTSSMLQDVRAGRATEIDYINGYIIRRGRELGIDCNNNERLVQLVKNVDIIDVGEIRQYFPDYAK